VPEALRGDRRPFCPVCFLFFPLFCPFRTLLPVDPYQTAGGIVSASIRRVSAHLLPEASNMRSIFLCVPVFLARHATIPDGCGSAPPFGNKHFHINLPNFWWFLPMGTPDLFPPPKSINYDPDPIFFARHNDEKNPNHGPYPPLLGVSTMLRPRPFRHAFLSFAAPSVLPCVFGSVFGACSEAGYHGFSSAFPPSLALCPFFFT